MFELLCYNSTVWIRSKNNSTQFLREPAYSYILYRLDRAGVFIRNAVSRLLWFLVVNGNDVSKPSAVCMWLCHRFPPTGRELVVGYWLVFCPALLIRVELTDYQARVQKCNRLLLFLLIHL